MGKVRSRQFFARKQFNLRKQKEKEEKREKQKQQQQQQQLQEELAEAHEEVERLETNIQVLQQRLDEALNINHALERGNRENQAENTRLHERNTRKRN
jgi:esterase/lipase